MTSPCIFSLPCLEIEYDPSIRRFSPPPIKPFVFGCPTPKTMFKVNLAGVASLYVRLRSQRMKSIFVEAGIPNMDFMGSSPGVLPTNTRFGLTCSAPEQKLEGNIQMAKSIHCRMVLRRTIVFTCSYKLRTNAQYDGAWNC